MTIRRDLPVALALLASAASAVAGEGRTLPELFKRLNGSVVIIRTREKDVAPWSQGEMVSVGGLGSGTLISSDGQVLTAAHLVQAANEIAVDLLGGETIGARVISSDPAADVALLQLTKPPKSGTPIAPLGDSDAVEVGDQVFIVGAPRGIGHTLTVGHISARRKPGMTVGGPSLAEFFQTDAAINKGNSGGPMFNMDGELIGIVSYIVSQSGGSEGLGFVVTSNVARQLTLGEKSFWSGLDGYLVTGDLARTLNVPPPGVGLLVQKIADDSPAAHIGLKSGTIRATIGEDDLVVGGDIILAVQGIPLGGPNAYDAIRRSLKDALPGDRIVVKILRGGETLELTSVRRH
ncbi:MAG TPA: trypsin-like peptidase domain-containing protein [Candidatus Polarisedimenticolia bacterium]|nr:trypsin-like peptidase domain-containing protein [Candidatus Polarisedimenticolia bacterium]